VSAVAYVSTAGGGHSARSVVTVAYASNAVEYDPTAPMTRIIHWP
jgi:hypothetical protein